MAKKSLLGLLGFGLVGIGAYFLRRQVIGRILNLQRPRFGVQISRGIRMPMQDGVNLAADLFSPISDRLFPTVLIRTAYGRGSRVGPTGILHDFVAQRFAERGYNVLVQDVRGCFESEGEFEPFKNEATDGRSTLEWIEKQTWFNGQLGMWGPSYLGYVQWAIANAGPLYLKAIVPVITSSNIPYSGLRDGSFTLDTILRWIIQIDAIDRKNTVKNWMGLRRVRTKTIDRILTRNANHLPLSDIDRKVIGRPMPFVKEWMEHLNPDDSYWKRFNHSPKLGRLTASAHLVSGWYDIFLRETLEDYNTLREYGHNPYLTIGPWHHLDGECLLESVRQGLVWFDVHLKGDRRKLRSRAVQLYVMGDVGWLEFDVWPPVTERSEWYLHSADSEGITQKIGLESTIPAEHTSPDRYIYDPANPTPSLGGALMSNNAGPKNNTELEQRRDVLTFTSKPLTGDLTIIGYVRLWLYVQSTLDTTDFFARLLDVDPDGQSINICDGFLRVTNQTGNLQPDESSLIEIDMWATAYRLKTGNRIRLLISSGAHPRWNRNLGTLESPITSSKMLAAEQTIYHDTKHPSVLILPNYTIKELG